MASKMILDHITTVLNIVLICAPRPIQLALGSTLPDLRPFVRKTAEAMHARHEHFKAHLPSSWRIGSQGGYFAFVRHPFNGRDAMQVCERMAAEGGIIALPAQIFTPQAPLRDDDSRRWIRFSVANVDDETLAQVCRRLSEIEQRFGWELDQPRE